MTYPRAENMAFAVSVEWHSSKNSLLLPTHLARGSRIKVWWECSMGHEWQVEVKSRVAKKTKCPYCSGNQVWKGFNDLATTHPELSLDWHPTKNESLLTSQVSAGSSKDVWWQCEQKHEWKTRVSTRASQGQGCQECKRQTVQS